MQNAKDTFYMALRSSLAVLNPDRTVVVRGAIRPAVVVEENELEQDGTPLLNTFVVRWINSTVDISEPSGLYGSQCTVTFATRGTTELSGMDRGRVLEALGYELRTILVPSVAVKQDFTGDAPLVKETNVFWSLPAFEDASESNGVLTRVATVHVFALGEEGAE
jgi:hypothetical protein